jgi:hypothetical protein
MSIMDVTRFMNKVHNDYSFQERMLKENCDEHLTEAPDAVLRALDLEDFIKEEEKKILTTTVSVYRPRRF